MYFECYKCNLYKSSKKSNIINHLSKKNKCDTKNIMDIIDLNDKEILERSLIPKYKVFNNENKCNFCNKNFKSDRTLKFHINNSCKLNNVKCDKVIYNTDIINIIENHNENHNENYIENHNEIHNETHIINNFINPTFNFNLVGFEQEWKLDHITEPDKKIISFCHFKYTTLLREILTNFVKLNVFIDKKTEQGYVYNNCTKNFEKMDKNKIVEDTIDKLHKNLIDINDNIKKDKNFYLDRDLLNLSKNDIEIKYNNYNKENTNKKEQINKDFLNIYKNKIDETKKNFNKVYKKNLIEKGGF